MESKIDKTIEMLCDYIEVVANLNVKENTKRHSSTLTMEYKKTMALSELTKALAELISARASSVSPFQK